MDIRPIRTDEDHASALREIERLWGAEPGSSDGDRLDVLATLVNAYEEDNLCGLLEVLAAPPVIALGKAASERLTELEIEHAGMPHPQYMRRFKNDQQLGYGQKLVGLIGKDVKEFSWPY